MTSEAIVPQPLIQNRTFEEIEVGESATLHRVLSKDDILLFAAVSGDVNPAHVDEEFARSDLFQKIIAHGMWGAALISTVLGTELPGPGTIYLGQTLRFKRPVSLGDHIYTTVTVKEKKREKSRVILDCKCLNQKGEEVITGEAEVLAPNRKVTRPRKPLPEVKLIERYARFREIIRLAEPRPPVATAVAHPVDAVTLTRCVEAWKDNLIEPILIGPEGKIRSVADAEKIDIDPFRIVDSRHSHEAAGLAISMALSGEAELIMKGTLSSSELYAALQDASGLRTERRLSHVYALDVPTFPRTLYITDTEIAGVQDLSAKAGIVQNAVDLLRALGVERPKVAILSAGEEVDPLVSSTLDAAALCKMAERDQIKGAIVDGPMPFDLAVSSEPWEGRSIRSPVAGNAEILVAPDMEAGRILVQQLRRLIDASAAGILLGLRVPVILPGPKDNVRTCEASCALAALWVDYWRKCMELKQAGASRATPLA